MTNFRCRWIMSAVLGLALGGCFGGDSCGNTVRAQLFSPDGKRKAVLFERDCGATTNVSTQLSVLEAQESLPNDGGNALVLDDRQIVQLRWLNARTLRVAFAPSITVYQRHGHVADVAVRFAGKQQNAR